MAPAGGISTLKDGPYRMFWQKLLSCELLSIPAAAAADIVDYRTLSTVITEITHFRPGL
jgi:hypothetical protein